MTNNDGYAWVIGGRRLHLKPRKDDWPIWDVATIAGALSKIGRWSGHTQGSFAFSVAQHSVVVSYLTPAPFELEGLFHDASEFILNDVATPVKALLNPKRYKALANEWDDAFAERLELSRSEACHTLVKRADRLSAYHEARLLVGVRREELAAFGKENGAFGEGWGADAEHLSDLLPAPWDVMLSPLPPDAAAAKFMRRYEELRERRPLVW